MLPVSDLAATLTAELTRRGLWSQLRGVGIQAAGHPPAVLTRTVNYNGDPRTFFHLSGNDGGHWVALESEVQIALDASSSWGLLLALLSTEASRCRVVWQQSLPPGGLLQLLQGDHVVAETGAANLGDACARLLLERWAAPSPPNLQTRATR